MEDFHFAGGLPALLGQIRDLLHLDCITVNGQTLGDNLAGGTGVPPVENIQDSQPTENNIHNKDVIRLRDNALSNEGGTFVLHGNLAPQGAVIKVTAASERLLKHKGPAVVFKDYNDMMTRLDDESLDVTADSVLVLQSAGPLGAPGMPEWEIGRASCRERV